MLLFSRREVFRPTDLDLNESVTNTMKLLKRIMDEQVVIRLTLSPRPMFVHADTGMLDQILLNLAINSRDAMPRGGVVNIETFVMTFDEASAKQTPQARPGAFLPPTCSRKSYTPI